jgi:hypothetical protein
MYCPQIVPQEHRSEIWLYMVVPEENVNILGGDSLGHSKQKSVHVHVSYFRRIQILS